MWCVNKVGCVAGLGLTSQVGAVSVFVSVSDGRLFFVALLLCRFVIVCVWCGVVWCQVWFVVCHYSFIPLLLLCLYPYDACPRKNTQGTRNLN